MKFFRDRIDAWYFKNRERVFEETREDPELAHENFVAISRSIDRLGLSRLLLNCPENRRTDFELSNAAGFNKNGDIPPRFLKMLGFDRVVVGTVTGDNWPGKDRPRIKRYVETGSMINWMGLPGVGANLVAHNLKDYGDHYVPLTINLMSTPRKKGEELLEDLHKVVDATRYLHMVNRWELNISCPNTHASDGRIDARKEHQSQWDGMLGVVGKNSLPGQGLWVKVSPDMQRADVKDLIDVSANHDVEGFVVSNSTRFHDPRYITSAPNLNGDGGATGNAVYDRAKEIQLVFNEEIGASGVDYKLIACGGIDSPARAWERLNHLEGRVIGVQVFTPLIYNGPRLLRRLRKYADFVDKD